jgi:hypothetical protein
MSEKTLCHRTDTVERNALSPKNGKGKRGALKILVCWLVCQMKLFMTLYNVAVLLFHRMDEWRCCYIVQIRPDLCI